MCHSDGFNEKPITRQDLGVGREKAGKKAETLRDGEQARHGGEEETSHEPQAACKLIEIG